MLSAAGNKLTEAEGVEAEKGSGLKKNVVTDSWMEPGVFGVYYQSFANAIMDMPVYKQSTLCGQRQDSWPEYTKFDQDVISYVLGSPDLGCVAFWREAGQTQCLGCPSELSYSHSVVLVK